MDDITTDSVTVPPFTGLPGRTTPSGSSPVEYFQMFFDDTVIDMLVNGTNQHVAEIIARKESAGALTPRSRWRKWRPVTPQEMKAVLAVLINMGVMHCPDLNSYWKTSWESNIPFFHDVFPRDRFELIYWGLHIIPSTSTPTRRINKIKPLLDHLLPAFQAKLRPGREIAIDETMVGFKGVVGFRQYCPLKPTKWGLKSFVLADSVTGYVLNIIPYTGGETKDNFLSACDSTLPMLAQIVVALSENYLDKGHHLYCDRLYSSVPLVRALQSRLTCFTGTVDRRRRELPSAVRPKGNLKLSRGDIKAWRDGEKLVVAWKDKGKPTFMISTAFGGSTVSVRCRRGGTKVKPLVVERYNKFMGGVDIADQFGCYYSFDRRTVKWWRKLFFWLMEVSIVNAYILYKGEHRGSHVDFRRKLVVGLCEGFPPLNVRRCLLRPPQIHERLLGSHFPSLGDRRRRCTVCNTTSTRHDTKYFCKTCTTHPALHVDICFERYHTLQDYLLRD